MEVHSLLCLYNNLHDLKVAGFQGTAFIRIYTPISEKFLEKIMRHKAREIKA
jgi:hypothetical protein